MKTHDARISDAMLRPRRTNVLTFNPPDFDRCVGIRVSVPVEIMEERMPLSADGNGADEGSKSADHSVIVWRRQIL